MIEVVAEISLTGDQLASSARNLHGIAKAAVDGLEARMAPTGNNGYRHFETRDMSFVGIKRLVDEAKASDELRLTVKEPDKKPGVFICGQLLVRTGTNPTIEFTTWTTTANGPEGEESIKNHPDAVKRGQNIIAKVSSFGISWGNV